MRARPPADLETRGAVAVTKCRRPLRKASQEHSGRFPRGEVRLWVGLTQRHSAFGGSKRRPSSRIALAG